MEQKTYKIIRIIFSMVLAGICSISVMLGNYVLPAAIGITAAVVLYAIKRRVSGVLADERDYRIAGDAARWSLNIYAVFAALVSMFLMARRGDNVQYYSVAQVLAYSACFLMIVQNFLFKRFQNKK